MVADPQTLQMQREYAALQRALAQHRNDAFVDYTPIVCGLPLRPITYRSYRQLLAFNSAFVTGAAPTLHAIAQFVWLHHPEFSQFAHRTRRRVFHQVFRALHPRLPTLNALVVVFQPIANSLAREARRWSPVRLFAWLLNRLARPTSAQLHAAACEEIRRLVEEALRDFPVGEKEDTASPVSQFPWLVGLMQRAHVLTFAEAREFVDTAPLRQTVEWVREALHRLSSGKQKLLTAEEARLWVAWMDNKQAALDQSAAAPARN